MAKIKQDKEQKFKSEGEALAFYRDIVKKINEKLFKIIPRDLITPKGINIFIISLFIIQGLQEVLSQKNC